MVGWLLKCWVCERQGVYKNGEVSGFHLEGGHSTCCYRNQLNTEGGRRRM